MAKILSVVSGKGGTGKSTFTAGLALSLARLSSSVLVIDLDIGLRSLDLLLGLDDRVVFDLGDVLDKRCKLEDAIVKHKTYSAIKLLCSPLKITQSFQVSKIIHIIKSCVNSYDYILLDLPAGLGLSIMLSKELADLICVVTMPDQITIRDTRRVCDVLAACCETEYKVVINNVNKATLKTSGVKHLDELLDNIGAPLLGVVRRDDNINKSLSLLESSDIIKSSNKEMQNVFDAIAKRIKGEYHPLIVKTVK